MNVGLVVVLAVVLGTATPVAAHLAVHGVVNPHQIGLAFFFWLNAIIAFWELCLFRHIDLIEAQHRRWREPYRGRELDRVKALFGAPMGLGEVLATHRWAEVWSSYALFDDSYADRRSYGFMIDVGNGMSTLLPSLLFAWGMTLHVLPARALGLLGLVFAYQMFYGTVLYLGSFVINRRYEGHRLGHLVVFVALSNGIWLVFPLWAIAVCLWLIEHDSYGLLL